MQERGRSQNAKGRQDLSIWRRQGHSHSSAGEFLRHVPLFVPRPSAAQARPVKLRFKSPSLTLHLIRPDQAPSRNACI